MFRIKIVLVGTRFHWLSHLAAVVTDLDTQTDILIDYPFSEIRPFNARDLKVYKATTNTPCVGVVTLYCHQADITLYDFYRQLKEKYKLENFGYTQHNCTSAVKFTLNYFFPHAAANREIDHAYYLLYWLRTFGTLGWQYFNAAPNVDTPRAGFEYAKSLEAEYGGRSELLPDEPIAISAEEWNQRGNPTIKVGYWLGWLPTENTLPEFNLALLQPRNRL